MSADYYATLGVDRDAGDAEIKRAFRAQARQLHPDVNRHDPEAEEKFKEINAAYEVLSDPQKRAMYDRFGTTRPQDVGGFGGFSDFGFDPVSDIFGMFFGDTAARATADLSGRDLAVELEVTLPDAVFGAKKEVTLDRSVRCGACAGSGAAEGGSVETCAQCQGRGVVRTTQRSFLGSLTRQSVCPACGGVGQVVTSPCPECAGQGRRDARETLTLEVPPGAEDGTTLRISGAGEAGLRGSPAGDLYVHVRVLPHDVFERHGDNLYALLPVSFFQAALGAKVRVATLDGEERVAVPAGTQPGERFVIKGKGAGHLHGRGRGDLVLEALVEVPRKISKEKRRLLEQIEPDATAERVATLVPPRARQAR